MVWGDDGVMFIDVVTEEAATGPAAEYYAQQREGWGFLPDYVYAFGARPDVAAAWGTLSAAVRAGMDRRRYELATLAAARALRSTACTVAHSMFLRDECDDEATVRLIAQDPDGSSLPPVDRAVYEFAGRVAVDAAAIQQTDVDALRAVGLSDADITSIVYVVAARCFFTRVLDGLGVRSDPQNAQTWSPELLASMIVGRPVGQASPTDDAADTRTP
jgi:uncharacterized peroxidase-related enzyme